MLSGKLVGRALTKCVHEKILVTSKKRKEFLKHGKVFLSLDYCKVLVPKRITTRRFVKICEDEDVQYLTFESCTRKEIVKRKRKKLKSSLKTWSFI